MSRILLVEPDRYLAELYSRALSHNGHSVLCARTVARAITLLDTERIDVLIVELQIAQHNGIELLYEMRSYVDWNDIRIIIHSYVPEHKTMVSKTMQQLNIDTYLYKPRTSLFELCAQVERTAIRQIS